MSQLRCNVCDRLTPFSNPYEGARCQGMRLVGSHWRPCTGVLVEHECGGPQEACGLRGCHECVSQPRRAVK
jgi:hypothetical protein